MAAEVILRVKVDRSQYNAFKKEVEKGIDPKGTNGVSKSIKETGDAAQTATTKIQSLGEMLTKKIAWYSISMAITSVTTAFKDALNEIKEVDKQLVNISKVSNKSLDDLQNLANKAYSTASKYGVEASKYMEAVYEYTKAGFHDNADAMAELSTKAMLVGDTTAAVADKFLIAGNAAWKYGKNVEELSLLVDKADYINNNYATTFDKIAEGFPRVASVASMAGMSAEQTMAALGTITATTQETASRASTALRALIINILGDTVTEIEDGVTATQEQIDSLTAALRKYAPEVVNAAEATGSLVNPMEALKSLSIAYSKGDLTQSGLFEIEKALGGKLRTNQLDALLKNFDMYEEMLKGMGGAAGTADKEISKMLESWSAKSQILKNTWTEFVSKGFDSGAFKTAIDWLTKMLDRFDGLNKVIPIAVGSMLSLFAPAMFVNIEKMIASLKNLKTAMGTSFTKLDDKGNAIGTNWAAVGTAVSIGIAAVTTAYTIYKNHIMKVRQDSQDAADAATEVANKARTQFDSIIELYSAYQSAEEGSEAYKTASENLSVALRKERWEVEKLRDSVKGWTSDMLEAQLKQMETEVTTARGNILTQTSSYSAGTDNPIIQAGLPTSFEYDPARHGLVQVAVSEQDRIKNSIELYKEYQREYDALVKAANAKRQESEGENITEWTRHWENAYQDRLIPLAKEYYSTMDEAAITSRKMQVESWLNEAEYVKKYLDAEAALEEYQKAKDDFDAGKISQEELAESAKNAAEATDELAEAEKNAANEAAKAAKEQEKISSAFKDIVGNATDASEAIERYKKMVEGDTTDADANALLEAGKKAVEDISNGLKDSPYVKAFADVWLSPEKIEELAKAGISTADYLANDANFQRIFIKGTDDKGETVFNTAVEAAKELAGVVKEFDTDGNNLITDNTGKEVWARIYETADGPKFIIENWERMAETFGMATESFKIFMNEYGMMIPGLEASSADMLAFADATGALTKNAEGLKEVDLKRVIDEAFAQGADQETVWRIANAFKEMADNGEIVIDIDYDSVDEAVRKAIELRDILKGKTLQEYLTEQSAGGNVDLTIRPVINTSALKEAGFDVDGNNVATTFTHTFSNQEGNVAINFTPILPDGTVMEREEFEKYCEEVVEGVHEDTLNLQIGSEFNGEDAITQAEQAAEKMHIVQEEFYKDQEAALYAQIDADLQAYAEKLAEASGAIHKTFDGIKQINIARVISQAFKDGADVDTIWDMVEALEAAQENGDIELVVADDDVSRANDETKELIDELGLADNPHYVHINSYSAYEAAQRVNYLNDALNAINGKFVSVGVSLSTWAKNTFGFAEGTDFAPGGATLVNEEGPELILEKGKARIAGGGHPTITNLQKGAKVWTAKETKAILGNSNLDELYNGIHAYASGTPSTIANVARTTWGENSRWNADVSDNQHLKYLQSIVTLRKAELDLIEESGGSISWQVEKMGTIQTALLNEIKHLQAIGGSQEDIVKLTAEWYSIQNKIADMTAPKIIAASELYSNLQKSINKQISDLQDKRDAELKSIDKQIEALQKAHDVQAQTNELKEKELAVTKAQQELDNAKAQRKVRVWNAAKGRWEWTYNASNVKSATENLTSAKQALTDYKNEQAYQKKIDDLEAKQLTISQKYNTQIEKWQKVLDSIEEPVKSISASMKELLKYTTSEMSPTVTRIKQAFAKNGLTFDSGGVLRGLGGIKATSADEVILPPDVTKKMLSPVSSKMFSQRLNELRYIYGATGNLAGYTNNAIGSQHNGDIYTFGNVTLSTEQAKNTTVYDLVRMARGLRSYASAI